MTLRPDVMMQNAAGYRTTSSARVPTYAKLEEPGQLKDSTQLANLRCAVGTVLDIEQQLAPWGQKCCYMP